KVIGGGMPVGAFGGRGDVMAHISPLGPVYQAGTLSGNPLAMAAGLANLRLVQEDGFYEKLGATAEKLTAGMVQRARAAGIDLSSNQVGGMFGLFFTEQDPVSNFSQVMACDQDRFVRFFHGMLREGIYLAPSAFETGFVSSAHDEQAIDTTLEAAERVFATLGAQPEG
ncbi:MAG: aminotransferase class III-fold pyridoxal phosphate-dependent enzyme, partial [Gammaproteobacteria bacterium]|nr:aminotransferase class III-fold pyridoxal phosphate-dependent enzyme [Gammaproteobacteria bacterium]